MVIRTLHNHPRMLLRSARYLTYPARVEQVVQIIQCVQYVFTMSLNYR